MPKLIVANWKANPDSPGRAAALAKKIEQSVSRKSGLTVVIAPPYPFLSVVGRAVRRVKLGAQDVFWEDTGPYTGEVSWHQLRHLGVAYVIVGHSERRMLGETDARVNRKVKASLKAGFTVILCVGEPLLVRRRGLAAARNYVKAQLRKDLAGIARRNRKLVVAYEPVWAISTSGTGQVDTPEDASRMAKFIKGVVPVPVLYGGSVDSKNARAFLGRREIDGALVGGASLKAEEFKKIITVAQDNAVL